MLLGLAVSVGLFLVIPQQGIQAMMIVRAVQLGKIMAVVIVTVTVTRAKLRQE